MKFISDIRLLLIGLWLGAAVFFIAVAQSAFAVLPSREMAGSVVSRTLLIINVSGLIIGLILLATSLARPTDTAAEKYDFCCCDSLSLVRLVAHQLIQ